MTAFKHLDTTDAGPHIAQMRDKLHELAVHAREDADQITDPAAKSRFEWAAEVLEALEHGFELLALQSKTYRDAGEDTS